MLNSLPGAPPAVRRLLASRPLTEIRPGLSRTREMLEALGSPHRTYRSLQVAGTNGKGSVATAAAAVLDLVPGAAPVGTYLSPHVVSFGERIQIGGRPAPEALLEDCAERVLPEADRLGATHFEALTVLALLAFAEAEVEWAVVETGMGGRLDATTVVDARASAVTPVSLDHQEHLGPGLAAVAREKAGVLREGRPAAVGPQPAEVDAVLDARAGELGAPILRLGDDAVVSHVEPSLSGTSFRYRSARSGEGKAVELRTALAGRHQAENAGLALLLLEAAGAEWTKEQASRGLAGLRLPGRMQVWAPESGATWILDLAHNPGAMAVFLSALEEISPPRPWSVLCSVLADKDWPAILDLLGRSADAITCTVAPTSPASRRWDLAAARERVEALEGVTAAEPGLERARARAVELAGAGTVLITGSSYLVGDVLRERPLRAGPG